MKIPIILGILFVLIVSPYFFNDKSSSTLYVSGDGTGDYNCDGSKDQIEINMALERVALDKEYNIVHLKGPHTYLVDSSILMSSDTILEGEQGVVIKLIDNAHWSKFNSIIRQKDFSLTQDYIDGKRYKNITIRNFEINGNANNQKEPAGQSYYSLIFFQNTTHIKIYNMYLHNNLNDAITITSAGVQPIYTHIYNNRISSVGHDGIYILWSTNFDIYNNIITGHRTDAGIRVENGSDFKIYNNTIGNNPDNVYSGSSAIQIESKGDLSLHNVSITDNYLFGGSYYHGIWLNRTTNSGDLESHSGVSITNNIISSYRGSGVYINGFNDTNISNNIIEGDKSNSDAIGAGVTFTTYPKSNIKGFKTIVRGNIIINNPKYGIENLAPNNHIFISNYNSIYGNKRGNYFNTASITDRYKETNLSRVLKDKVYPILHKIWREAESNNSIYNGDMGTKKARELYHLP